VNRRRIVTILALLALLGAACSNAADDSEENVEAGGSEGTTDDDGPLTYAEVLELPIDENVPVTAPGVDDSTIRVGGVASTTNPIGLDYAGAFDGARAYFEYINSEGGIYGRQLELVAEEDDNTGFENQQDVQSLLTQDLFAVLPVATLDFAGAELLVDANMPTYGWNINEEYGLGENLFGTRGFLCFTCPGAGLPWLAQELGAEQVATLAYDVPQSADCAEGIQNSFDTYPTAELAFVDTSLPYGIPDLSAQVRDMKAAGVDLVTTCMDYNGVTTLQQEMRRQELDATQYLPNGYDYNFLAENGDLFDGAYVLTNFVPFEVPEDEKPEGLLLYEQWIEEIGEEPAEISLGGWMSADMFVTGLRAAGPEFSQQGVIDGLNQLTDYDFLGLSADIDWTVEHEEDAPVGCNALSQIQNGAFVPVFGEPGKPFTCFDDNDPEVPETPIITD
jgi:ABC-type branched-subunit amino acid transport system substrate-binding protein